MSGKPKTIGLALIAALALSALASPSASASMTGEFTSLDGYPIHLSGTDFSGVHALTGAAGVDCTSTTYTSELSAGSSSLDITPSFSGCAASSGAPATITHNGCKYRLTLGTGTDEVIDEWHTTTDLVCPAGKQIEVHIYNSAAHTTSVCTLEFPAQNNLNGLIITDQTTNWLIPEGTIGGISNYASGGCTGGATVQLPNAELHVSIFMQGTNGKSIHIGATE